MAVLNVNIQSQNEARTEIASVQRQIVEINRELAENRKLALSADDAQKESLRTQAQKLAAERAVLRSGQQSTRLRLAGLREEERAIKANIVAEQRAARDRERLQREQLRRSREIANATRDLTAQLTIASTVAARAFGRGTENLIRAASEMQTFRQTVIVAEGDILRGEQALQRLLDVTVELVGIDTQDLLGFYSQFRQSAIGQERTISAISGVTKAIAEQGRAAHETNAVLVQSLQVLRSNRISVQDYNSIISRIPQFARAASEALGVQVGSVESFREAAESVGGPANAMIATLEQLNQAASGANLDTFNSQLEILRDNANVLASEIGQELLPVATDFLKFLNELVQDFRDADPEFKRFIAYGTAAAAGLTGLTAVIGGTTLAVGALNASINGLLGTSGIAGISRVLGIGSSALRFLGSTAGIATTGIITLGQAWNRIYSDFQRTAPFADAADQLEVVTGESELVATRMAEIRRQIVILSNSAGDNRQALSGLREEYRALSAQLTELRENAARTTETVAAAPENLILSIVRANEQLRASRETIRSATTSDQANVGLSDIERAITEQARVNTEIARKTIDDKQELEAELAQIEIDAQNARTRANREYIDRQLELSRERWEREQAIAQATNDAIQQRAQQTLQAYAAQLRQINSPERRRDFVELVNSFQEQGLSFEAARERAGEYIGILNTIPPAFNAVDAAYGQFQSHLDTQFEALNRNENRIRSYTDAIRAIGQVIRENREDETLRLLLPERDADQREQDFFDRNRGGQDLTDIQRQAGEEGNRFVNALRARQEQDLERSLNRQDRLYVNFYRRLGSLASSGLLDQLNIQNRFVEGLLGEFTNIFVRITALKLQEKLFDDNITNAKILNQRRLQGEILNTAAVSQRAAGAGAGALGGLGGFGVVGAGLGILGLIASLIGGRGTADVNRRVLNAERTSRNTTVVLRPSSEFAREEHYVVEGQVRDGRV